MHVQLYLFFGGFLGVLGCFVWFSVGLGGFGGFWRLGCGFSEFRLLRFRLYRLRCAGLRAVGFLRFAVKEPSVFWGLRV